MAAKKSTILELALPITLALIFGLLAVLGALTDIEHKVYDSLLRFRTPIKEDVRLTIVDIDDQAINVAGTFPWPRDIIARGLVALKELGASYITFDIEFLDPSPYGVNKKALEVDVPEKVSAQIREFSDSTIAFIDALATEQITNSDAMEFLPQLQEEGGILSTRVVQEVQNLVQNNDIILGQATRLFGNAYATLNHSVEGNVNDADFQKALAHAKEFSPLQNLTIASGAQIPKLKTLTPPIIQIATAAKKLAFTNMDPDADGITRRVLPLGEYEGKYYGSLLLVPLLDMLGNPPLLADGKTITISLSKVDSNKKDIVIPLDADGMMLINWVHDIYKDSFNIVSFAELILLEKQERQLADIVKTMTAANTLATFDNPFVYQKWTDAQATLSQALAEGSEEYFKQYMALKEQYFSELTRLSTGESDKRLYEALDLAIGASEDPENAKLLGNLRKDAEKQFKEMREALAIVQKRSSLLRERLGGTFCITGWTGTSTTDLGVTPFEAIYMNVGVHTNVANTILNANFLQDIPPLWSSLAALLIIVIIVLGSRRLKPLHAALTSFGVLIVFLGAQVAIFIVSGMYTGLASPGMSILASSISLTLLKFRAAEKEKGFIRGAFARYLSDDVIKNIVANPKALNLGGEKRNMTAIFTDVKGFSTISEKLDPTDLVKLLNEYLSAMSDLVLDSGGFIDKYEGDAIIAFWGAPIPYEDHAKRSCQTALKMRRIEAQLNPHFVESKMSPTPLLTRIGINTGEMVVGNMGTERRLNYTIMGNAVNLAARLEGVNKQYGTWILISQYTRQEAGEDFLYRSLDRVRVVGINTPVRLYEVVEERSVVSNAMLETVGIFEKGIELFEKRQFVEAKTTFEAALEITADDAPSKIFLKRCEDYIAEPPPQEWDAVFNLTSK